MKKNISINISSIIFHIEEDGYERLKEYLEAVNRYFSKYEDNLEIVADIESRIAEIFLAKLDGEKQVITADDVESMITVMGTVSDFKAAEEDIADEIPPVSEEKTSETKQESTEKKRLYRDKKRKIIAGVAAGIAHYFTVDPIWVRIIFCLLFFGLIPFPPAAGFAVISYIILWIAMPASETLEENTKSRKIFRNPDDKVIGGISSGIAAYFGIDPVVVRLLFVISVIFFGTGVLAYIVLWIIIPEAKTRTDKMKMQGEPVTLENIENNIKKSLHAENKEENTFIKVLLFPFRLIASVFKAITPLLVFIGHTVRITLGVLLILIGAALVSVTFCILIGLPMGFVNERIIVSNSDLPLQVIVDSFPTWSFILAFILVFIPFLSMFLSGIGLIAKRRIIKPAVAWSLAGIWTAALIGSFFIAVPIARSFNKENTYVTEQTVDVGSKTLVLKSTEEDTQGFEAVTLQLKGYEGDKVRMIKKYESRGETKKDALKNAQNIVYRTSLKDSVLMFSDRLQLQKHTKYRGQRMTIVVEIPYNKNFVVTDEVKDLLEGNDEATFGWEPGINTWKFTPQGAECIDCDSIKTDVASKGNFVKNFSGKEFDEIKIIGGYTVNIHEGSQYKVAIFGNRHDVEKTDVDVHNGRLTIGRNKRFRIKNFKFWFDKDEKDIKINIEVPKTLKTLEVNLKGAIKGYIKELTMSDLTIDASGASSLNMEDLNTDLLTVDLSGASELSANGRSKELKADLSGACELNAQKLITKTAYIDMSGAGEANIFVTDKLVTDTKGACFINYDGNPSTVIKNGRGISSIEKKRFNK